MKIKTSELVGAKLDYAVALCEGKNFRIKEKDDLTKHVVEMLAIPCPDKKPGCCVAHFKLEYYSPSTNWSQGGPIIEWAGIDMYLHETPKTSAQNDYWTALRGFLNTSGDTLLVAAMRCYVASKLGNEVEVPEDLR